MSITTVWSDSAKREIDFTDPEAMPYPRLKATIDKYARNLGGGTDARLDAMRAELTRRPALDPTGAAAPAAQARSPADRNPATPLPREAVIGDNAPPSDIDLLNERLEKQHPELLTAAADLELRAATLPKEVTTEEDFAKITAWVVEAAKVKRSAEAERTEAQKPVLFMQRGVNAFFGTIKESIEKRTQALEARKVPYLKAKAAREEAERRQKAEELRRAQQEAIDRENEARRQREAAAAEAKAAEDRLRQAKHDADMETLAHEAARANRVAQTAAAAEEQAAKDIKSVTKAVDREEKILAGEHATHVLGKTSAGGANTTLATVYRPDVHNRDRLKTSLGPLGAFLPERVIEEALERAAKADPRPSVPGVDWIEEHESRTRATRS